MAITCPNCRSAQLDGSIFCLECGASLLTDAAQEATREIGGGSGPMTAGLSARSGTGLIDTQAITLIVVHSGNRLRVEASETMLIGRTDPAKGIHPEIDLGPEGGYDAGVSRKHAVLSHRNGIYHVEDLASANGTYVNGKRLMPQAAVQLRNGDELKCGTLVLRVELAA